MSFYNGEPFRTKGIVKAKVNGKCPTCKIWWDEGDRIRACEREPYGDEDWFHMHIECAENHPMRVKNNKAKQEPVTQLVAEPVREEFKWVYGSQRDAIRYVMDYGTCVVEYMPNESKGRHFRYRVL